MLLAAVILCASLLSTTAPAKSTTARILYTELSPWVAINSKDEASGIIPAYFNAILKDTSITPAAKIVPIGRIHQMIQDGDIDMFIAPIPRDALPKAKGVKQVYQASTVIISSKTSPPWKVGIQTKTKVCRSALSGYHLEGHEMVDAPQLDQCAKMLISGRIQYMVGEKLSLLHILNQINPRRDGYGEIVEIAKTPMTLFLSKKLLEEESSAKILANVNKIDFNTIVRQASQQQK